MTNQEYTAIVSQTQSHTQEPWALSGTRTSAPIKVGRTHRFLHIQAGDEIIASVYFEMKTGLGFADGKLMAAAPALLAEVRRLREALTGIQAIAASGFEGPIERLAVVDRLTTAALKGDT